MEIVKSDIGESVSPKYNPNLRYTWTPNDVFTLTGEEFGMVLNAFRAVLSTPESARIIMIKDANDAIENTLARGVEAGIVKEAPNNNS